METMNKGHRIEQGFVSLLVLLVTVFISCESLVVFLKVEANARMVQDEARKLQTGYAADSGLAYAEAMLTHDKSWTGETIVLSGQEVVITVQKNKEFYRVVSTAKFQDCVQKRFAEYRQEEAGFVQIAYGELYGS